MQFVRMQFVRMQFVRMLLLRENVPLTAQRLCHPLERGLCPRTPGI